MKQANHAEIDRLLQRHARRWNAAMSSAGRDSGGGGAGAHLDADEMSAYAEGALPAAAHARSVAHLADCETCRRLVTELVLAAEVAGEGRETVEPQTPAPSKSWWSVIAALFAPPVLRFAVPALLLLGIIVVAFVATRETRQDDADYVALNEQKQSSGAVSNTAAPAPSVQPAPGESAGGSNTTSSNTNANQSGAVSSNAPPTGGLIAKDDNAPLPPPAAKTTTPNAPAVTLRDSPDRERELDARVYDGTPKAAPAQPTDETTASNTLEKQKAGEEQQGRKQGNEPAAESRTETADISRAKDEDKANPSVSGGSALGRAASEQPGSRTASTRSRPAARRADSAGADNKGDSGSAAETRSVGGRRFRRQGNAWVDTAYNSSRSTINVARGSDQYRALVADEPAIRNFADQLGGEVIVVWKGKAYRIY